MTNPHPQIRIEYDPIRLTGILSRSEQDDGTAWDRLRASLMASEVTFVYEQNRIEIPWTILLGLLREFGSKSQQRALNFRFSPVGEAVTRIGQFSNEVRSARSAQDHVTLRLTAPEIQQRLLDIHFTKRHLTTFQLRDISRLLAIPHGANFSVPGAGKTTVSFALHLLTRLPGHSFFVVAPRSAFPAWKGIITECLTDEASAHNLEPFTVLDLSMEENVRLLCGGASRFLMSYDLMVRQAEVLIPYFARQPVHLLLDEAHRMKAGLASQRGAFLLNIASLPVRRDILTGTPMPQGADDLAAQLGFLWPGQGLDLQIKRGTSPRAVLGELYVRTTKNELGIPPAKRHFWQVKMAEGQMALYGVVRNETLRQLKEAVAGRNSGSLDLVRARRSVMRLLQLSSNPILALQGISESMAGLDSGIIDEVLAEGASTKVRAVENHARTLARQGRKIVVWTIFTDTLLQLERMLADINPVTLYGAVPNGAEDDIRTREGRLRRFHEDPACMAIIANPAAAGEGISLHTVCHEAIYVDRSYVATHYLQSIDRIHRLGLPPDVQTNIHIYQTKAPVGLGSIDLSVSRRLRSKIRNLQQLLDDPDLHEIAFDEENSEDPIDYDVQLEDLVDLIEELEGRHSEKELTTDG